MRSKLTEPVKESQQMRPIYACLESLQSTFCTSSGTGDGIRGRLGRPTVAREIPLRNRVPRPDALPRRRRIAAGLPSRVRRPGTIGLRRGPTRSLVLPATASNLSKVASAADLPLSGCWRRPRPSPQVCISPVNPNRPHRFRQDGELKRMN